ncbi:MAG: hypothetical protein BGO01_20275 [Armatimonadetes bacterium 55-13]|nr:MAG: hypothetical protein BGO01_20275 [Armatimonadetes bacterium 55-13]
MVARLQSVSPLVLALLFIGPDKPGTHHLILPKDLPKPYAVKSKITTPVVMKGKVAPLQVPPGFKVNVFAAGLQSPRNMAVAPNGDVFVVESYRRRISLLRVTDGSSRANKKFVFATGLNLPYGIALHKGYLYVANTDGVVRFPYKAGQTAATTRETVVKGIPGKGYHQHWTRNLAFSPDGNQLFVTVGSETNKNPEKPPRASIQAFDVDGSHQRTLAFGMRNPVGIAFRPGTNEMWATCVERDYMGDDVVPDYVTRVKDGDFFGWPWYYIGKNRDPKTPLKGAPSNPVRVPDVLVDAHSVPLGFLFYQGGMFPSEYRGDAFVAMRGSTNRRVRSGYKVVRIKFENGKLVPGFEDFVVGWAPDRTKRDVYGRPVGLAVWNDGSLLIADEGGHTIYRVSYDK